MILSERYFSNVRGLSQLSRTSRIRAMLPTVKRSIHVGMRNRVLYDAVKLLERDSWDPREDVNEWSFERVGELRPDPKWRAEIGEALFRELEQAIEAAARDTCRSFEEFQTRAIGPFGRLEDFLDWYYLNLPYAALGLVYGGAWDDTVNRRIEWMLDKSPEPLDGETRELLVDYGRRFMFDWHVSRFISESARLH